MRERLVSGELRPPAPPQSEADAQQRVGIDFDGWAFAEVSLAPQWVDRVGVQQLNDAVDQFLVGRTLPLGEVELPEKVALDERARRLRSLR